MGSRQWAQCRTEDTASPRSSPPQAVAQQEEGDEKDEGDEECKEEGGVSSPGRYSGCRAGPRG